MTVVGFGIVPHGAIILADNALNDNKQSLIVRDSMIRLNEDIDQMNPDVIFISTPHGISLQNNFGIYLNSIASGTAGYLGEFEEYQANISLETEISLNLLRNLKSKHQFVEGITSSLPSLPIQLRWGEVVPIFFMNQERKFIIMSQPSRRYDEATKMIGELKNLGSAIYDYLNNLKEKIYIMISGDLAHTHQVEGPYGFSSDAKTFDKFISEWISTLNENILLEKAKSILDTALSCGYTGFVMLQGMINQFKKSSNKKIEPNLISNLHPTYFGMAVANFRVFN